MQTSKHSLKKQLIIDLYSIGAVKFGQFTLKSGVTSSTYMDLRLIISHPPILRTVAELLWSLVAANPFDLLCGIPYTALPIATAMSLQHNIPMILRRKEKKSYGTQQQIEGAFQPGNTCLLIEDVITSGSSVLETAADLAAAGLRITDIAVLIDREQGGKQHLEKQQYTVHAALTQQDILRGLLDTDLITVPERDLISHLLSQ